MPVRSLKIGVIYGGISEQKSGMDHYLHQVLSTMKRLVPDYKYTLIDHRHLQTPFREQFQQLILDLPQGPARVSRWNILTVPRALPQFDLVFSPGLYGPIGIPAGVASVMVVHDLTRYLFPHFFPFNVMQKVLDRMVYPSMLRNYHHILAVSQATRQDLVGRFKIPAEKITVAYHGAEESFQPMNRHDAKQFLKRTYNLDKPFILFLGTLEPRKNIPTLLRAFSSIKEQISQDLILVGQKGWKWEPIFKEMERSDLKERVHWIDYIPDQDRVYFYNAADVLAYPSWYEGFGMPLLEAMQCGCPVITSNSSAMPEVIGDAGLLIDPSRVESLKGAMLRLIREPELAEKMKTAGLMQAKKFSWETSARITLEVFEKVVLAHRSKPKALS